MPAVRIAQRYQSAPTKPVRKKRGFIVAVALIVAVMGIFHATRGDALANIPGIQSGVTSACLDLRHNDANAPIKVQVWGCNNSAAEQWSVEGLHIQHADNICLGVANDATAGNSPVTVASCSDAPGQVWLSERGGYRNPHSDRCLNVPDGKTGVQLTVASCKNLGTPSQTWTPVITHGKDIQKVTADCSKGDKGSKIACSAAKEWAIWQAPTADHTALLNMYTDGASYEAWCADFVSYVYKEAGYPFTQGETDGWNENNANKIESMGFVRHDPNSYTPKTGDIAYFDYEGGHVEIVASGGKTPTFIYGNSGTTDPATGNGQMAANTITSDGPNGSLVYYLSPQ